MKRELKGPDPSWIDGLVTGFRRCPDEEGTEREGPSSVKWPERSVSEGVPMKRELKVSSRSFKYAYPKGFQKVSR